MDGSSDQIAEWSALPNTLADFPPADFEETDLDALSTPDFWCRNTRSGDDGKRDSRRHILPSVPRLEPGGSVRAHDQNQFLIVGKGSECVDGIGRSVPFDLTVVDLQPFDSFDRETAHLKTMSCRGDLPLSLLPGVAGGDNQHPVETELIPRALGGVEMGDVDRIEGPAEDSGSHGDEDRDGRV